MSADQSYDPLDSVEDAQQIDEIDGDEDLNREDLNREAPHESESLEEPVLNADGDVVPVPEHDPSAFSEPDAEVYGHQTNFGTEDQPQD